ncbi:MAG: two-component regulator propeller domain-containing protein [Acidobacteriota bacterium]|nr:two-component regulator propeller domain-containing protein [Acidobacteriota bacterium]
MKHIWCRWLFLVFAWGEGFSQGLPLVHYLAETGRIRLPSSHILSTHQDRMGYLWILLYSSGAVRYDGLSYDQFTAADGLPDLYVYAMVEDAGGRLWVGCAGGLAVSIKPLDQFGPNERVRFQKTVGDEMLSRIAVKERRLTEDRLGNVWLGVPDEGLIRYRIDSGRLRRTLFPMPAGADGHDIHCLTVRRDGRLWAGVSGGLVRYESDRSGLLFFPLETGGEEIDSLFEDRHGDLWAGGNQGTVWRVLTLPAGVSLEPIGIRAGGSVSSFLEDGDQLWIASYGGGMVRLNPDDPSTARTYTRENGLLSNQVSHIFRDREDNLWISQNLGLSKLRANYQAHTHLVGASEKRGNALLPGAGVQGVVPFDATAPLPYLFAATDGGGLGIVDERMTSQSIDMRDGIQSDQIHSAARDVKGRIWIGSDLGIDCLSKEPLGDVFPGMESNRLSLFGETIYHRGFPTIEINSIRILHFADKELICFPGRGGVFLYMDEAWFFLGNEAGMPEGDLYAGAVDPDGHLWIGSQDHGLYRSREPARSEALLSHAESGALEPGFVRTVMTPFLDKVWGKEQGAPTNHIRSLIFHRDMLWTGTARGLAALDPESLEMRKLMSRDDGIGADNMTSMALSPLDGSLWVGTNGGLTQIDPVGRKVVRTIDRRDGLLDNEVWYFSAVALDTQGRVYFGNHKGISIYDPSKDMGKISLPRLHFRNLTWSRNLWGKNELAVSFHGIGFFDEEAVRYKTRLHGFEEEWSEIGTQTTLRYTNLPAFFLPKKHRFQVMTGVDGVRWSEPLTHAFVVYPPLWLRWWFLIILVLSIAASGYGFGKWRNRLLEARARELEKTVEDRTRELKVNNATLAGTLNELKEKNEDILNKQEQLILSQKMASVGILARGVAHELRNPLNFINNLSQINMELADDLKAVADQVRNQEDFDRRNMVEVLLDLENNTRVIARQGHAADQIVSLMLELSASGSGQRSETSINPLVSEYVDIAVGAFIEEQDCCSIDLLKHFDERIGALHVSPQNLGRAIINLVRNGLESAYIDCMHKGLDFRPQIKVETYRRPEHYCIRVSDNGPGIAGDIADHIFTPFFTTRPAGSGNVGLGLTVAYDVVVKEHGGTLRVLESDEGAVFEIALPRDCATKESVALEQAEIR